MGSLIHLADVIGESGEPSTRAALLHIHSALSATEGEIENLLTGQRKLEAANGEADEHRRELHERIGTEALTLVEKMKRGAKWTLSQFGSVSTMNYAARLSATSLQSEIAAVAMAETAEELRRLEERRERLLVARAGIVREVVRESLQDGLVAEYGNTLAELQAIMVRLEALQRYFAPSSHDWKPCAARRAVTLPNYAHGDGSDMAVIIEPREVGKIEALLASFAAALEYDPRTPAPEFPAVDTSPDTSLSYERMSAPERLAADREFMPPEVRKRPAEHY